MATPEPRPPLKVFESWLRTTISRVERISIIRRMQRERYWTAKPEIRPLPGAAGQTFSVPL